MFSNATLILWAINNDDRLSLYTYMYYMYCIYIINIIRPNILVNNSYLTSNIKKYFVYINFPCYIPN